MAFFEQFTSETIWVVGPEDGWEGVENQMRVALVVGFRIDCMACL